MGVKLGLDCKLYRNAGSHESPDWQEVKKVRDVTVTLEKGEADVTSRANNGWRATKGALKDGTLEFDLVWDTADESFAALRQAWFDGTPIEMAAMDGAIDSTGSQGLRATYEVMNFSQPQPLEESVTASVTVRPTDSDHAPEWMEIS